MDTEGLLSVYLALAGMQATLVTLVVAGLIAIYQVVGKQIPRRSLNSVVSLPVQIIFILYTALLFVSSLLGAWALATKNENAAIVGDATLLLWIIIATILSYGIFIIILFKGRALFDNTRYIALTAKKFSPKQFGDYLFAHYSTPPFHFKYSILTFLTDTRSEEERDTQEAEKESDYRKDKAEYEAKIKKLKDAKDPLGELFQYALKSDDPDDTENVVMPLITAKLMAFIETSKDLGYLGSYVKDAVTSMLASKSGSPDIGTKRVYIDMIVAVANALIARKKYSVATDIASQLHIITRDDKNEATRLYGIKALENITDEYDKATKKVKDWRKYLEHYQNFTLIAARMAENYYHSLKNMTPVAIVEDNHHEIESFHNVMANYLMQNDRIYERFPDAFPALYFDAIDLSAEAFAGAIARSESVAQDVGSTRSKYNQTLSSFYYIFYAYAKHGIESGNYQLVDNCIYRLERGIEFCSKHELTDATISIGEDLYHLGVMLTSLPDDVSFGELSIHNKHEILNKMAGAINEHVLDMEQFKGRKSGMDHTLFDYIYKKEAAQFVDLIDWDRDELPDSLASDFLKALD